MLESIIGLLVFLIPAYGFYELGGELKIKSPWMSFVPVLNVLALYRMAKAPGWMFWVTILPFVLMFVILFSFALINTLLPMMSASAEMITATDTVGNITAGTGDFQSSAMVMLTFANFALGFAGIFVTFMMFPVLVIMIYNLVKLCQRCKVNPWFTIFAFLPIVQIYFPFHLLKTVKNATNQ